MNITLNGKPAEIRSRVTAGRFLDELKIGRTLAAVEVNGKILDKSEFDFFVIPDGAVIEIIRFMGGG
ncbi:MAG: thiamine biosynthesis protein ThiS [Elusimicrobia bacterium HGW-Elusimicrobia-1]|jgi:thiamine biosynthesis protein ThiS|nr:MAG: thiamine biosynthesis protein ThiS [Elusimicrobia bacterium HGW-Elusimicrobia-3]PKN01842.1 MAG: thiamine biosynthesis protein ThiS [Elusimicrobia bacterium HGW-Elusimicrobia-1]